jgi:hypothetical protein
MSSYSKSVHYNNQFPIFSVLGILIITIMSCLFLLQRVLPGVSENFVVEQQELTISQIRVIEVLSGHSWQMHGAEVSQAFDCLGKNGSAKSFKTFGFIDNRTNNQIPTNLWLCFDGKDYFAIVTTIFEKIGNDKVAKLVTAYKVATDLFPSIDDFIQYLISKWQAIEINYSIEAGEIFLNPK